MLPVKVESIPGRFDRIGTVENQVGKTKSGKRVWWLLVLMMLLLNIMLWSRTTIAGWIGAMAIKSASDDDFPSARREIELARWVWRQSPEASMAAARLARREGKLDAFAMELKRAQYLGVPEDQAERELLLASAQGGQLRLVESKLSDLIATSQGEEPQVCEAFAQGYMRMRNFNAALVLLEAWAKDYPSDPRPHAWIGLIYSELQSNEAAEDAFRKSLKIDPRHARAALGLGNLLIDLKRPGEAADFFRIAMGHPLMGAEASVGLATSLQANGNADEAIKVLSTAAQEFPDNYEVVAANADALIKSGKYDEAEKLLAIWIKSGTLRRELRYYYAIALRGLGRADEAAPHFEYAAEANKAITDANLLIPSVAERPEDADLRYQIGSTHLRYGNVEDGLMWLKNALEVDGNHAPSHAALGEYYQTHSKENPSFPALAQHHRMLGGSTNPPSPRSQD